MFGCVGKQREQTADTDAWRKRNWSARSGVHRSGSTGTDLEQLRDDDGTARAIAFPLEIKFSDFAVAKLVNFNPIAFEIDFLK